MLPQIDLANSNNQLKKLNQSLGNFRIQRQTAHNYFKNIRPNQIKFESIKHVQKRINTQNCCLNSWQQKENKLLKQLKIKKKDLNLNLNSNFLHINSSFNKYIQNGKMRIQIASIQRKKTLSCKNLLKELKSLTDFKKNNFAQSIINQQGTSAEMSYQIDIQKNQCFDTLFSFQRYSPSLHNYNNELFLLGGNITSKVTVNSSCFHSYNFQKKTWQKVQQNGIKPSIIPCFHTAQIYKNYLILIGGIAINPEYKKRKFNQDINIFNFEKLQWTKLRGNISIRSHASTLFANTLLIHGGINQKQTNSSQMHFINFNPTNIHNSIILSTHQNKIAINQISKNHNLSFHKLVNTFEVQTNLKISLPYDGVFCFGGIDGDGHSNSQISFLNCIGKQNSLDVRFQNWIVIQSNSIKPKPRKNHTFNIINKKATLLLIGGQDIQGIPLKDVWTFDLIKLQWKQIMHQTVNPYLCQGISNHCTAFVNSKLFVFGGRKQINKDQNFWSLQTDVANLLTKRIKYEKAINLSNQTIKSSTKQSSMWNIQF